MTPKEFWAGEATTSSDTLSGEQRCRMALRPVKRPRYLRYQSGAVHMDQATGRQISSDNVIVVFAEHELTNIVEDSLGTLSVKINLYGFGRSARISGRQGL